jgi:hypothetical protein
MASLSWQGGAQSTICVREPALGPNHGLRPEMSPNCAIYATAARHPVARASTTATMSVGPLHRPS